MDQRSDGPARPTPLGTRTGARAPRTLRLPAEPGEVRRARTLVQATCRAAGLTPDTCDTAVLLTSETVTNALMHSGGDATLSVCTGVGTVRVEVGDGDHDRPHLSPRDPQALSGRGLEIVALLARQWGVEDRPPGKVVWFEVAD